MKIIVCLDDKCGMAFGGRRQSRDRVLCERILEITGDARVLMSPQSHKLFTDQDCRLIPDSNYLSLAQGDDYCFIETDSPAPFEQEIKEIIIFRWNRVYPSDLKFNISLDGFSLTESREFKGSSHEKITEEVYRR